MVDHYYIRLEYLGDNSEFDCRSELPIHLALGKSALGATRLDTRILCIRPPSHARNRLRFLCKPPLSREVPGRVRLLASMQPPALTHQFRFNP